MAKKEFHDTKAPKAFPSSFLDGAFNCLNLPSIHNFVVTQPRCYSIYSLPTKPSKKLAAPSSPTIAPCHLCLSCQIQFTGEAIILFLEIEFVGVYHIEDGIKRSS